MPDCDYCGESFDGQKALDKHLGKEHLDELGRIDRRRVTGADAESDGLSTGPIALILVIGLAVAITVWVTFLSGGGSAGEPHDYGAIHEHGTIEVTIVGDTLDFSQPKYQFRNTGERAFHFEGGNGDFWHVHAEGVTLKYAMDTIGVGVTDDSVTYNGTTYTDGEGYEVIVQAEGKDVDPAKYVLHGGTEAQAANGNVPHVRVIVREA
jgi:hypothetical protein